MTMLEHIRNTVIEYYKISIKTLNADTHARETVEPRQVCMYLACLYTKRTIVKIGKYFGNRNHATVIHARKNVNSLMQSNIELKFKVEAIERKLKEIPEHKIERVPEPGTEPEKPLGLDKLPEPEKLPEQKREFKNPLFKQIYEERKHEKRKAKLLIRKATLR